jgi:ankyrin repeat protein
MDTGSCVICLDDFKDDDKTTKLHTCDHVVHTECFLGYVNHTLNGQASQVSCPICRRVAIDISDRPRQILLVPPPPPQQLSIPMELEIVNNNHDYDQYNQYITRIQYVTYITWIVLFGNLMYLIHMWTQQ